MSMSSDISILVGHASCLSQTARDDCTNRISLITGLTAVDAFIIARFLFNISMSICAISQGFFTADVILHNDQEHLICKYDYL